MTSPQPRKTAVLTICLAAYLMILVDNSVVFTGLPTIERSLGFSPPALSWVQNAYTLTFGGFLLLGARLGDLYGRRRVFVLGIVLFTASSLAVGLARSPAWLIAARAFQGTGSAIAAPATLALLTSTFPAPGERTRALALYGAMAGGGAAVGLVLGGAITGLISWRYGFFVNVPIGIAIAVAARRWVGESERRRGRLDLSGAITSTLGMTALVFGMVHAAEHGWSTPLTVAPLGAGALLIALFVLNERRAPQPITPLRLFRSRERSGAYLARLLFVGAMFGFFFFTTQLLQGAYGFSPLQAGLAFLPMTLVNFPVALTVPRLTRRFGNSLVLAAGLTVTAVGMGWLSRANPEHSYALAVALPMTLVGAGQGLAFAPLTAAGVSGVSGEDGGAASGLVSVAHQVGGSLGLSVLVTVFAAADESGLGPAELLAHRVSAALRVGTGMLVLALLVALALIVRPAPGARTPEKRNKNDRKLDPVLWH
jgi:EmrB/QacA subfamily drug resistance transporter